MNVLNLRESRATQFLLCVIFLGLLFTLPVQAQQFGSQKVISDSVTGVLHVKAANLIGEGLPEVITGADQDGSHRLMLSENTETGFGSGQVIGSGSDGAREVGVADVDGDEDLDILAASGSAAKLSWYENQGSGSFGSAQVIDSGFFGRAQAARVVDVDGDGDPDVLSSDWGGVYWYENQNGSFGGGQQVGSYDDADEVAVGDLNGDGTPDVIGGAADNGEIAWHANQGGGSFGSKQQITTRADGVQKIAAVDVDSDGDLDVLSASLEGSDSSEVAWYENENDGFGSEQIIGEGNVGGRWLTVADFNGDNRPDVATASAESDLVGWHENTGGNFGDFQTVTTEVQDPQTVAAADANADGAPDLISASQGDGKIAWYENRSGVESGLADAPWPRDGRDLQSTGRSPNAGPEEGEIEWSFQSDAPTNRLQNVTVGANGTIYVGSTDESGDGSDDNNLYAVNPDGSQKWVYDANPPGADESGGIQAGVAIGDGRTLYAGSASDHIHAIEENGSRKWINRLVTQRNIDSSPAVVGDGTVYIGTNGGDLYALTPDGSVKWSFDTGGRTKSPAVASDGTIYVGVGDLDFSPGDPGKVYAINPDGTQKWVYQTGGEVTGDPAIDSDGTVYVGAQDGKVYAFNPDGTLKWSFSTSGYVKSDPAIGPNGTVYVGSKDDHLYALNPDGSLKWEFQTGGDVNSAPAVGGEGRIYVGSQDSTLYALNADGSEAWSLHLAGAVGSPAIGANGRIYVGAGRKLYALGSGIGTGLASAPWPRDGRDLQSTGRSPNAGPEEGGIEWSFQSDAPTNRLQNVTVGANGTIYVGSTDESGDGSDDNNLYAVNPDGSQKWVYDANPPGADESGDISTGAAISDEGTLYAGSASDHIHAIRSDGSRKWINRLTTQANVKSSPAIVGDGTIYIGTNEGKLHAINPDGSIKWTFDTGGRTHSPAVASDGTIYVGVGDLDFSPGDPGKVYAINPDGTQKWVYQTGGEVTGDPAIDSDGTVYVGAQDGKVYAFNPDGTLKWSFSTSGYVKSDPAIGPNGTVYVGSKDDHLYALNPDGSLKWEFQTGGDVSSAPAVGGDGRIYVGSQDSTLYALNADGSEAWSLHLAGAVGSPAIGANGRIYATAGRRLYAVGSSPTIVSSLVASEGLTDFGDTGVTINFYGVGGQDTVTVAKYYNPPSGRDGIAASKNVSDYRFVIEDGPNVGFDSSKVRLSVATLAGISDPTAVTIYKRSQADSGTFSLLETNIERNGTPEDISDDTLYAMTESFGEFVLASDSEPLPVELTMFEGAVDDGAVQLTWQTASEIGNARFDIQRRVDVGRNARGGTWERVGQVHGAGTTSESRTYRYTDTDLPYGVDRVDYRLKQVDTDGSVHYSTPITVERGIDKVQLLGTYPNPARSQVTVRYALPKRQRITMQLYDALGRRIRTVVRGQKAGRREQRLDVSNLASGVYFLRLKAEDVTKTQRLTVVQ